MVLSSITAGAGPLATVVAALVTAVATVFLWRVTRVLAVETKRMADASAQPQVVVSIEPNQWTTMYADIIVANTGNAAAFDIVVNFDPPVERDETQAERPFPLERVSLLRPGQQITSFLSSFEPVINRAYTVTVSWKRDPQGNERESLSYQLDMSEFDGRGHLGAVNALNQIADEVKKMREDWRPVAQGSRKLSADVFSSGDRLHQQRQHQRYRRQRAREQAASATVPISRETDDQAQD